MSWKRLGEYAVKIGEWVVGKAYIHHEPVYILTKDSDKEFKMYFKSFDEVKEYVANAN